MQLLFDFLPVLAFFIAFKTAGIFVATAVVMVAMVIQSGVQWFRHGKISPMLLVSTVLALVFGGVTLLVHNEAFIKIKFTVVEWLFATAFLISAYVGEKPIIERLLSEQIVLERKYWYQLNAFWTAFFVFSGGINLFVAFNYDTNTWATFKLYGMMGLTLVFVILQGLWLSGKLPKEDAPAAKPANDNHN